MMSPFPTAEVSSRRYCNRRGCGMRRPSGCGYPPTRRRHPSFLYFLPTVELSCRPLIWNLVIFQTICVKWVVEGETGESQWVRKKRGWTWCLTCVISWVQFTFTTCPRLGDAPCCCHWCCCRCRHRAAGVSASAAMISCISCMLVMPFMYAMYAMYAIPSNTNLFFDSSV